MYLLLLTGIFYFQSFSSTNPHCICQVDADRRRGSGAWPCSELLIRLWSVGLTGTDVSESGMMLMGSQLWLIITAQSKRVWSHHEKSLWERGGVNLSSYPLESAYRHLILLLRTVKAFPCHQASLPVRFLLPPLSWSAAGKAEPVMGCKCSVVQLRLVLSFHPFRLQTLGTTKPNLAVSHRNNSWHLRRGVCSKCFTNRQYLIL